MGCGFCSQERNLNAVKFVCAKFLDIYEIIIPFFRKYKILGVKSLDFEDFCKAAEIFKTKGHLTFEGSAKILDIKKGINLGRVHEEPSIEIVSEGDRLLTSGPLYIYNSVRTILLFITDNEKDLTDYLKIRKSSLNKYITLGSVFLGRFTFSQSLITTAKHELITLSELKLRIDNIREKKSSSRK